MLAIDADNCYFFFKISTWEETFESTFDENFVIGFIGVSYSSTFWLLICKEFESFFERSVALETPLDLISTIWVVCFGVWKLIIER